MKKLVQLALFSAVLFVVSMTAWANCDEADIEDVLDGGRIITLDDGTVWESLDPATSATWLAADTHL